MPYFKRLIPFQFMEETDLVNKPSSTAAMVSQEVSLVVVASYSVFKIRMDVLVLPGTMAWIA